MKFLAAAAAALALAAPAAAGRIQRQVVFVLAGQSNMVGYPVVGPGPSFSQTLGGATVVQCAVDGSTIGDWQPGQPDYGTCLQRVGGRGVAGVVFMQGESEAIRGGEWAAGFQRFAAGIRSAFGAVPIVFGQTGTLWPGARYQQNVRDEQASVPVSFSAMVVSTDLPTWDGIHFTADAYTTLGERFARAWWTLTHPGQLRRE